MTATTKNWYLATIKEMSDHLDNCTLHVGQCGDCAAITIYLEDKLK